MKLKDHLWNMYIAIEEAEKAYAIGEVPVGAVLVDNNGVILSQTHNLKETHYLPCGHAEILALNNAGREIKNWRLEGCTLYVTLEPWPMCLGAMIHARISQLIFGAYDFKGGAISLNYNLHKDSRLNHAFSVIGGIRNYQCSQMLSSFFKEKRKRYKTNVPKY